jgi:hypothetical protein
VELHEVNEDAHLPCCACSNAPLAVHIGLHLVPLEALLVQGCMSTNKSISNSRQTNQMLKALV